MKHKYVVYAFDCDQANRLKGYFMGSGVKHTAIYEGLSLRFEFETTKKQKEKMCEDFNELLLPDMKLKKQFCHLLVKEVA